MTQGILCIKVRLYHPLENSSDIKQEPVEYNETENNVGMKHPKIIDIKWLSHFNPEMHTSTDEVKAEMSLFMECNNIKSEDLIPNNTGSTHQLRISTENNTGSTHQLRISTENKSFETCVQAFVDPSTIQPHVETNSDPDILFTCGTCGVIFKQSDSLETHRKTVHLGEKPFGCETCGKRFMYRRGLKDHEKKHAGDKPFICETCGMIFTQSDSLQTHRKQLHAGNKLFTCQTCAKRFTLCRSLARHVKMYCKAIQPCTCETCGKMFSQNADLKLHMELHPGKKPIACDTCGRRFSSRNGLMNHRRAYAACQTDLLRIHAEDKSLKTCGKNISFPSTLKAYVYRPSPFTCKTCGMRFEQSDNLQAHMKKMHLSHKPFECETCGKGFMHRRSLKDHEKKHTCNKTFTCANCGKNFVSLHMKLHPGNEPFECDTCGRRFSLKHNLRSHKTVCVAFQAENLRKGTGHKLSKTCAENISYPSSFQVHTNSNRIFTNLM